MTPERFRQIEDIYHAARERPGEERPDFINSACGEDAELRRDVEALISSRELSGDFIEQPAFELGLSVLAGDGRSLVGREVGKYKVLSLIAGGGMSEVYLAEDTRLRRKVAVKSLYPTTTSDPDQPEWVWHEARAASAIVHPNVAQIYEVMEFDEYRLIVMEYVDGATLRQRLAEGPLTSLAALSIARQIAAALAAAHRVGVAHRDIKPENVMLLANEHVKVLDFGLAKRIRAFPDALGSSSTFDPVPSLTTPGLIIGTVPYMSPEQTRGREVDARSDLWSLGVVLYEMLTGRPPFVGETASDIVAAILERTPPPLASFDLSHPDEPQRILDHALDKEVGARYQTAREMYDDLNSLFEEIYFDSRRRERNRHAPAPRPRYVRLRRAALPLAVMCVLLLSAAAWWLSRPHRPEHFSPGKFEVRNFSESGDVLEAAISADGKFVVYTTGHSGQQSFWLKQVATADRIQLPQPVSGSYGGLTVSRDGNYIYYSLFRDAPQGELYRVSIPAATDSRKLLDDVDPPISLAPDERRFAFVRENHSKPNELIIADADGSQIRQLVSDSRLAPGVVAWSPRDELIACAVRVSENGAEYESLAGFNAASGEPLNITARRWRNIERAEWLPDMSGLVLIAEDEKSQLKQLWLLSYPGGEARRITIDIGEYRTLSVTDDSSTIATVQSMRTSKVWVDGTTANSPGAPTALSAGRDEGLQGVAWTPDGRIIYTSTASGSRDLWMMSRNGGSQKRLTYDGAADRQPVATPDGRYILFVSDRDGSAKIWRVKTDGTDPTPLTDGPDDSFPTVSPDNRWVVYSSRASDRKMLWQVPVEGGRPEQLTKYLSNWPTISPDGKYIACLYRDDPGTSPVQLAVIPRDGGQPLHTYPLPPGIAQPPDLIAPGFHWSRDGLSVLYVNTAGGASNVWAQPALGGKPKQLTSFTADRIFWFDISHTDNSLAYARGQYTHEAVLITDQNNQR
jgi:serine/threonine protein kinase